MSYQAQDIINAAMRFIGALATGETGSTNELNDGMMYLNEVIASLSAEGVYLYSRVLDTLTAAATTQSYTWGSGGNLNTTRPLRLLSVDANYQGSTIPVEILSAAGWAAIPEKSVQGNLIQKCYLDNAYPLSTLYLWPVPKTTSTSIDLYSLKALTGFVNLTDTFDFPPGYERAIKLMLAVDMAGEFGRPITPEMLQLAEGAKAALRAINQQNFAGLALGESPQVSANAPQTPPATRAS